MSETIRFSGNRADLRRAIRGAVAALVGRQPDATGQVEESRRAIGNAALQTISTAFKAKAAGLADEAGDTWPPLQQKTIAYSRKWPDKPKYQKPDPRAGRPLLSLSQAKYWQQVFARSLERIAGGKPASQQDRGHAAAIAWLVLKSMGGQTVLDVYGRMPVKVLMDRGDLLDSLTPESGHPDQILRQDGPAVIVGSRSSVAAAHHRGNASRGLPQRRLWPEPARWPAPWWQRLLTASRDGYKWILEAMLR